MRSCLGLQGLMGLKMVLLWHRGVALVLMRGIRAIRAILLDFIFSTPDNYHHVNVDNTVLN